MKLNLNELIGTLTHLRDSNILPPDAPVIAWLVQDHPSQPLAKHIVSGVGAGFDNNEKRVCATVKLSAP